MDQSIPALALRRFSSAEQGSLWCRKNHQWDEFSPKRILQEWEYLWIALKQLGVGPESGVGIIAPSSPYWIITDLAVQTCGAWTVPLFPTLSAEVFSFECEDSATKILVLQKLADISEDILPLLNKFTTIVVIEPENELPSNAKTWNELLILGKQNFKNANDFFSAIESIDDDTIASIIYTSGATGRPKGAEILHSNLLFQFIGASQLYPLSAKTDKALSTLPVAHVFERMAVYFYIHSGVTVYFCDDPKNLGNYLKEIHPTIMTMVPRMVEKLYDKLSNSWRDAVGLKRIILRLAIGHAKVSDPSKNSGLIHKLFEKLVYSKMRIALGDSLRVIISGSSALSPSIHRFMLNIGLPLFEGYGLTECSPTLTAGHSKSNKVGAVGKAFPGVQIRIGEDEEVLAKTPGVMKGYHNNPNATAQSFTIDGWFKTGDKGYLDSEGFLHLKGRLKEQFKTSTGKFVSPIPIEQLLCKNALIENAVVIAENRKFAVALLFIDHAHAKSYLRKADYAPEKAIQSKRILSRIEQCVKATNKHLNSWEHIKQWKIIDSTLTPESGLLTPTLKVRRHAIETHFKTIIDQLYLDQH